MILVMSVAFVGLLTGELRPFLSFSTTRFVSLLPIYGLLAYILEIGYVIQGSQLRVIFLLKLAGLQHGISIV